MAFLTTGTPAFALVLNVYGWRYQIGPWVRKGYRVVVPDMLGYGGTDKPQDPSDYSTRRLCADLAALLDLLAVQRAVVIGHDWGAFTAGRFALWHPDRLLSLIMLSVPYTPPSQMYMPIEEVVKLAPNLAYQAYFADPASTSPIENDAPEPQDNHTRRGGLLELVRDTKVHKGPSVLNDKVRGSLATNTSCLTHGPQEFQIYLDVLSKGGMNGPLNYYRTSKHRYEEEKRAGLPTNLSPHLPVLFMWGTADPTTASSVIHKSRKFISRLQDVAFEGRGHWLMVEAKDQITDRVLSWLQDLTSQPPPTFSAFKPRDHRLHTPQAVTHVAWNCDGKKLAAAGIDKHPRVWCPEKSVSDSQSTTDDASFCRN
ncbi:hypothetical protein C0995_014872 [Termitomyces sp. Mi166|nr:hypothetical protein C0995_014872 [Termitomyces sp. Mi166\